MSGTTSASLQSAAQAAAIAAAMPGSAAAASAGGTSATAGAQNAALQSLAGNFNDFLNLLTTQLQNQDPTSPMDTDSFTTELVQFTGVQEQVSSNSSLSALVALNQQQQLLAGAQYVGQSATVSSTALALQNSSAEISFAGTAGEPVQIAVVSATGAPLADASLTATAGTNTWTWNGLDDNGNQVPDGAYRVAVETQDSSGNIDALPFDVIGTTTGITNSSNGISLQLGALSVPLGSVLAIGN